ncbi:DUF3800 domain-containing protein [Brevibacillus sp. 7WMA2]|uniref:DUF3800 domain-containing protein n=1 Tax=Brevibacillus sp. 7WMA2 TaxID=2683193 RepID=UPI0020B11A09|nr:DUF3800 domain-containing protein [Brevibacillus sp. 7WMA2]
MILNFDESGNLGTAGRYFTIACVGTPNTKPLTNIMKKSSLRVKQRFPQFESEREIKASDSFPVIKDYILRKIASKDVDIRYVVADLQHVMESLLRDENLLYNYLLQFLIVPVAKRADVTNLVLNLDKRTIKVKSTNSFEDYINIKLNYELNCNVNLTVNYLESQNSYAIQAADFIANAVYAKYEYGKDEYYNLFNHKIVHRELFPRKLFGTDKIINLSS